MKKISFCLVGRNDNYGGNFIHRLSLSINYLARNAIKIKRLDDIEILITDWASEIPLSQVVKLSHEGASICHFIEVPLELAKDCNRSDSDKGLNMGVALNTAIRRATGEYIALMPADIMISEYSLSQLLKLLHNDFDTCFMPDKSFMLVSRKFIPEQFDESKISIDFSLLDEFLTLNDHRLCFNDDAVGLSSGIGLILFHHRYCIENRGVDESLTGWGGHDPDLGFRYNLKYPTVNLAHLGIKVFDFAPTKGMQNEKLRNVNSFERFNIVIGDENWGLGNHDIPVKNCNQIINPNHEEKQKIDLDYSVKPDHFPEMMSHESVEHCISKSLHYHIRNIEKYYYPIAWYGLYRKCASFLEYGTRSSYASLIISYLNPTAKIYYSIPLSNSREGANYTEHPTKLASYLHQNKHKGYVQFITGDPITSLDRVKESFIGDMKFDLVLFDADSFSTESSNQIEKIFEYLPKGGGLFVIGTDVARLNEIKNYVESAHPEYGTMISIENKIVIFIKDINIFDGIDKKLLEKKIDSAWLYYKRNSLALYLAYFTNMLTDLFKGMVLLRYKNCPRYIMSYIIGIKNKARVILDLNE